MHVQFDYQRGAYLLKSLYTILKYKTIIIMITIIIKIYGTKNNSNDYNNYY